MDSDRGGDDWEGGSITGDAILAPDANRGKPRSLLSSSLGEVVNGSLLAVRFAGPCEYDISLIPLSNSAAALSVSTSLGEAIGGSSSALCVPGGCSPLISGSASTSELGMSLVEVCKLIVYFWWPAVSVAPLIGDERTEQSILAGPKDIECRLFHAHLARQPLPTRETAHGEFLCNQGVLKRSW